MYIIKANVEFSGVAWGLHFINGVAETDNEFLANKLQRKGYEVAEKVELAKEPSKFDGMDVEQLKAYAANSGIDIGKSTSIDGIIKKITEAEKQA
ncbi:MAG: Uncharacterized protein K0R34_3283 [Herbinix sp.]|jgi:hypothetical protein|nr:Uncharacterized protein [Herbinix sp.]